MRRASDVVAPAGAPLVRLAPLRLAPVTSAPSGVRAALARGSGEPLVLPVRSAIEQSIGVDLAPVRVHHDPASRALVDGMGARAFAIGANIFLGPRERPTDLALMAHEVTHVVQQQGSAHIQRLGGGEASDGLEREADQVSASVASGKSATVAGRTEPRPQFGLYDWAKKKAKAVGEFVGDVVDAIGNLLGAALEYVKKHAADIPGYNMLAYVMGRDPITQKPVERNAVNLIRAVMGLWPLGNRIFEALQKYGIIDRVGAWLDEQMKTLGLAASAMRQGLDRLLDSLKAEDLLDLGGVWDRAKRIFSEPIGRITSFVGGLVSGVIDFIRDAVLIPLARLAKGTRGYDLIRAILGKDPISGEPVAQDAEALIGGFLKLIGQEEIFENMKKAKALPRAAAWLKRTLGELKAFVTQVPARFIRAFKALEIGDYIGLAGAIRKIGGVFLEVVTEFVTWAGRAIWTLLEIIFEVVSPKTLEYIRKTGAALKSILKNPMPFMGNLVKAAKLGFQNFADHFVDHLKAGLINWLVGALPGIHIPKAFTLGEVVKFVFSVLGIGWAMIRARLVKVVGETTVMAMEEGFKIVVTLMREGPAAAWEQIKEQLADLKDTVIGGIISMVVEAITVKAVPKLIAMFIPGAGFISAIIAIYDVIKVFIEKIATIVAVVRAFVDSIVSIAAGVIDAAAKKVESVLANLLSLAISFLANFAGLGRVADKIMGVIKKVQGMVERGLNALVAWIVTMAKKLFGAVKAGVKKLVAWWKKSVPLTKGGEPHTLKYQGSDRAASLMVHTKPKRITGFVQGFVGLKGAGPQVEKASDLETKITSTQKKVVEAEGKNQALVDSLTVELHGYIDALAAVLDSLLALGAEQGTDKNPLPIDYPKRRSSAYPVIYIGPRVGPGNMVPQTTLRALHSARPAPDIARAELVKANPKLAGNIPLKNWDGTVTPLEPGGTHNVEGVDLGLSEEFKDIKPGKVLISPGVEKTGGGSKVNKPLKAFGYVPKLDGGEGLDADHVMERQLGGPDHPVNLWPLPASENRSSGATVKGFTFAYKGSTGLTLAEVRKQHGKDVHLLIRKVIGG